MEYTKGKWNATVDGILVNCNKGAICQLHKTKEMSSEEVKANANLIASAPDLYEALILVYSEPKRFAPDELAKIGKALAKAEGK